VNLTSLLLANDYNRIINVVIIRAGLPIVPFVPRPASYFFYLQNDIKQLIRKVK